MRFITSVLAFIGGLTLLLIVLAIVAVTLAVHRPARIAANTVLRFDLDKEVTESPASPFSLGGNKPIVFDDLLEALDRAATDSRIKGVVFRLGDNQLGLSQSENIRDAILALRRHGKFAIAFGDSYGDISGGTRPYWLASACDEIWLQPGGSLGLTGVGAEVPFLRGTLDKLGIVPEFIRHGQYKTAASEITDTAMQASDRQSYVDLLNSLYGTLVAAIAEGRRLSQGQVTSAIDNGPYTAGQAQGAGLVDRLGYWDQVEARALQRAGAGAKMVSGEAYAQSNPGNHPLQDGIALINAVGDIQDGSDGGVGSDSGVYADETAGYLLQAAGNPHVKAILLRINSPGGSETASETIWHAAQRARAMGKKIVVYMSDTAASGGYYIAAEADRIVAEPTTITGSIGVFGGKFVLQGLADKIGVSVQTISVGANADMGSEFSQFSPAQQGRFQAMIDDAYAMFLSRVSAGRHIAVQQLEPIAEGHVWTGAQARQIGLVDELGGFDAALADAGALGGLPAGRPNIVMTLPRQKSPLAQLAGEIDQIGGASLALSRIEARLGWVDGASADWAEAPEISIK